MVEVSIIEDGGKGNSECVIIIIQSILGMKHEFHHSVKELYIRLLANVPQLVFSLNIVPEVRKVIITFFKQSQGSFSLYNVFTVKLSLTDACTYYFLKLQPAPHPLPPISNHPKC